MLSIDVCHSDVVVYWFTVSPFYSLFLILGQAFVFRVWGGRY